jgi:predicted NAD-dependent protein-ADP-ribosyltransferase YbiA (DUF1768 family)
MGTIKEFQGNNRFLSNFYPAPVKYEGKIYPTSEHGLSSCKVFIAQDKDRIAKAFSAGEAKRLGKFVSRIPDWDAKKLSIMKDIVTCSLDRIRYLQGLYLLLVIQFSKKETDGETLIGELIFTQERVKTIWVKS